MLNENWAGINSTLGDFSRSESKAALNAYKARPSYVLEHSNIEQSISQSGYGRKQLNELVQNAADAMQGAGGRIQVVLTKDALYCANEGLPFTEEGLRTLMLTHSSVKRDEQIGRFGLGFKSVLQITERPQIFSRTGSVCWDMNQSRKLLEDIYPGLDQYPVLRLAAPIDPFQEAAKDPELMELMQWASTVVKLPLRTNITWLHDELMKFPHHFLLFSKDIHELRLVDKVVEWDSSWTSIRSGERITLSSGDISEDWLLLQYNHKVSEAAAADAGSIFARSMVPVSWAIPLRETGRKKLGNFWNYFPTNHQTSLRGIINAPFKMNEDRVSMLETFYNREILTKAVPRMVAGALHLLSTAEDPAAHFDILPSRDREDEGWSDKVIYQPILDVLCIAPFLPDRSGQLRSVREINIQPDLSEFEDLEALWNAAVGIERPWLHPSASNHKDRRGLLNRVLKAAQVKRSSITSWLEEVVYSGKIQDYENALAIAVFIDEKFADRIQELQEMRRSRIVLMSNGKLAAPIRNHIFLPTDSEEIEENLVSYDLLHHGQSNRYLKSLGIEVLNGTGKLKRVVREAAVDYSRSSAAESIWRVSRSFPTDEVIEILLTESEPGKLLTKSKNGEWKPLESMWLSGRLLNADRPEDSHLVVDPLFHSKDIDLFHRLGMRSSLPEQSASKTGRTYNFWKQSEGIRLSKASEDSPQPVSAASIQFGQVQLTERLDELTDASLQTRAIVTRQLMLRQQYQAKVTYSSSFRAPTHIDGPDLWWVKNFGGFQTPLGLVETKYCTAAPEGFPTDFLPYPGDEEAAILRLQSDPQKFSWDFILPLAESKLNIENVHVLYGLMAQAGIKAPKQLLVQNTPGNSTRYPLETIWLAADKPSHEYFSNNPLLSSVFTGHEELDHALATRWSLKIKKVEFSSKISHLEDEVVPRAKINSLYPYLNKAASRIRVSVETVPCTSLTREHTIAIDSVEKCIKSEPLLSVLNDGILYYVSSLSNREILSEILKTFGNTSSAMDVLKRMKTLKTEAEIERKKRRIQGLETDAEKVAELVGRDTLRALLPPAVLEMLTVRKIELTDQLIFDVVSNLHGANLLKILKPALEEAGIDAPEAFGGGVKALEFVKELGFSDWLAGERIKRRPEREEVVGPLSLSPLHDFQISTARKIAALLERKSPSTRGLVQLPTGAGKTRVAVQSAIDHVSNAAGNHQIVWIAQSEELCEQAIDTWMHVWQTAGAPGERMAVSRLWGDNEATKEETKLHLIVATISKLSSIHDTRKAAYSWLDTPHLVIIDEAHGATTPSYTKVLKWFGRSYQNTSKLLLGLSATPFRGTNLIETKRLVARFGENLIAPDEFSSSDAHEFLQDAGVLAKVRHVELEGINLQLTDMKSAFGVNEQNVMLEARLDLRQVASSAERNGTILDHILETTRLRSEEGTNHGQFLVFAASVPHAEALAAVLSASSVPSAAISSKTPPAQRRRLIEEFRQGRLKVLTNFDVLSQGFDAPKVDAVYVCRPTFSPNKYIQMVGRGLRGKLNGGNEEVLIVNVKDNLDQYGEKLAYTEFDYLWKRNIEHTV